MEKKCEDCRKECNAHQNKVCYCAGRPECHECGWPDPVDGGWSRCDSWTCFEDAQKLKSSQ